MKKAYHYAVWKRTLDEIKDKHNLLEHYVFLTTSSLSEAKVYQDQLIEKVCEVIESELKHWFHSLHQTINEAFEDQSISVLDEYYPSFQSSLQRLNFYQHIHFLSDEVKQEINKKMQEHLKHYKKHMKNAVSSHEGVEIFEFQYVMGKFSL